MKFNSLLLASFLLGGLLLYSCKDDDAPEEPNEEEIITLIRLTFSPETGNPVVVLAEDPDGEGPEEIEISEAISLSENTTYELTIELENTIAGEDITEEVEEEGHEHQFFFAFTEDLFESPAGNGNIDALEDEAVLYQDEDVNGLPIGLATQWTTGAASSGTFRVVLKHQPDIKTSTSTALDGESDIDLVWEIVID